MNEIMNANEIETANETAKETVVVCMPWIDSMAALYRIEGSVERTCCRCQCKVSAAPSSVRIQRERKALIICLRCFLSDAEMAKRPAMPLTAHQMKELIETFENAE